MFKKTGGKTTFKSEKDLEYFIGMNLESILGIKLVAKQYRIKGEVCDILAVDNENKLHILELKNTEDRYVVQQLTRYYDNVITEKPQLENVNYDRKIKLVAIAPSFHPHNFIDRKYHQLEVDFWFFSVAEDKFTKEISFTLTNVFSNHSIVINVSSGYSSKTHDNVDTLGVAINDKDNAIEEWNEDIINYYMRLNHHSKFGIMPLSNEEYFNYSKRFRSKCTKEFIIKACIEEKGLEKLKTFKFKLPMKVLPWQFAMWAWHNMDNIDSAGYKKELYAIGEEEKGHVLRRVYYR